MFAPTSQIRSGTVRSIPRPKSEGYGHSANRSNPDTLYEGDTHSAGSDLTRGGEQLHGDETNNDRSRCLRHGSDGKRNLSQTTAQVPVFTGVRKSHDIHVQKGMRVGSTPTSSRSAGVGR